MKRRHPPTPMGFGGQAMTASLQDSRHKTGTHLQVATFRPSDLPTFRPSDLPTFRPSDLPTFRPSTFNLQPSSFPIAFPGIKGFFPGIPGAADFGGSAAPLVFQPPRPSGVAGKQVGNAAHHQYRDLVENPTVTSTTESNNARNSFPRTRRRINRESRNDICGTAS
jgi:hypothetical protein